MVVIVPVLQISTILLKNLIILPPKKAGVLKYDGELKRAKIHFSEQKTAIFAYPPTQEPLYFNGFTAYDLIIPLYQNQLLHRCVVSLFDTI